MHRCVLAYKLTTIAAAPAENYSGITAKPKSNWLTDTWSFIASVFVGNSNGPDWLDNAANSSAGYIDSLSFNLSWFVRDRLFGMNSVDHNSTSYSAGGWTPFAHGILLSGGVSGVLKDASKGLGKGLFRGSSAKFVC